MHINYGLRFKVDGRASLRRWEKLEVQRVNGLSLKPLSEGRHSAVGDLLCKQDRARSGLEQGGSPNDHRDLDGLGDSSAGLDWPIVCLADGVSRKACRSPLIIP